MRDMLLGLMDPMDKMSAVIAERDAEIKRLRRALEDVDRYVMPTAAKAIIKAALNT